MGLLFSFCGGDGFQFEDDAGDTEAGGCGERTEKGAAQSVPETGGMLVCFLLLVSAFVG